MLKFSQEITYQSFKNNKYYSSFEIPGLSFFCLALKCQFLISNWDQEKRYIMGNPIPRKVKLLSDLSILIKVDLWLVDWETNVSFSNAQNDEIQWRPASARNYVPHYRCVNLPQV